jgi:acetyl esterase/lipase
VKLGSIPLVLLIAISSTFPASSTERFLEPSFDVEVTADVVYGSAAVRAPEPGAKDLLLDLYQPAGDGAPELRPALLAVHGGGFRTGDKAQPNFEALCREFAARGYVCASINYRLEGDDPPTEGKDAHERAIAAAFEDAGAALIWLHDNAGRFRIDRDRIAMGGGSAGAITTLFVVYRFGDDRYPVRAVVDLWGGLYDSVETIDPGDPPLIIVHGTEDDLVPFQLAKEIQARAEKTGVECVLLAMSGFGHGVELSEERNGASLYEHIAAFLFEHLDLGALR